MPIIDLNKIKTENDKTIVDKIKDVWKDVKKKTNDGING